MEDNLRTAIQDYLEDYVYVDAEKTEDLAEILYNYLAERGWLIIDTIQYKKRDNKMKGYKTEIEEEVMPNVGT